MLAATSQTFTRKQYAFLGKIILQKEPELAKKYLDKYLPNTPPAETDYSKIPAYYLSFCKILGINPSDYIGPVYKSHKVHVRRQFIAVILHIYAPHLFFQPVDNMVLDRVELSKKLAELFCIKKPNISSTIREVILWEKQYEDFSSSVTTIIDKILTAG